MTLTFRQGIGSVLVYLKNHSMLETPKLRLELATGKIKTLTFHVSVTDEAGKTTALAFSVPPVS